MTGALLAATPLAAQQGYPGTSKTLPPVLARANEAPIEPVRASMHNVHYQAAEGVTLAIRDLQGHLLPARADAPPWFEDFGSFMIGVDTAVVGITPASLSTLLNEHVFNYPNAPIGDLKLSIEDGELKQTGKLRSMLGVPFTILSVMTVMPDGRLRLHPTSVKVVGLPVKGLMHLFSIELDNLVQVEPGRGISISNNDFLLSPTGIVPPPKIQGKVVAARIDPTEIVLIFGGSGHAPGAPFGPPNAAHNNYMAFRGGILRFGKLLMVDADLQIVDADPKDPFDFYLAKFNRQLVAGSTRNQPDFGLVATIPDYDDLPPGAPPQ